MRRLALPDNSSIPVIGQGTWRMGEAAANRRAEVTALQAGIDFGLTLIDTAEMYGDGGAEEVVGEAIRNCRDSVYLVSKVLPGNASFKGTIEACERSLARLGTDHLDLYLLHWRGSYELADTMKAFLALQSQGKIRSFGVSNFDSRDMLEWLALPGAAATQTDQVMYNVGTRGLEFDLAPLLARHKIPLMAYCPLAQGDLETFAPLTAIARRHDATIAQIMLAWATHTGNVFAVPKSSNIARLRENAAAGGIALTSQDLAEIDMAFPSPKQATSLAMT